MTGSVYIDLRFEPAIYDDNRDRRELMTLGACPAGAHVVIDIGERTWVPPDTAYWLQHEGDGLNLEIRGASPLGVSRFVRAAIGGEAWPDAPTQRAS